jgi:DNA replicative helicase MCM subunit Mcm2 (Cdc46/Mcm family)
MKTKQILLIALSVIAIGAVIAYLQYNKPHREAADEQAAFSLSANELFNDFQTDETSSNAKYLNKIIEVNGVVTEVTQPSPENLTVMLETGNEPSVIACEISPGQVPNPLPTPGDQVILKGICTGYTMDVVLVRCSIKNQ